MNKSEFFLTIVPKRNEKIKWENDKGIVTLSIEKSAFAQVIRALFNKPRIITINLDKYGSFIWSAIDGKKDFNAISIKFSKKFGKKIDPEYKRFTKYSKILRRNGFIKF